MEPQEPQEPQELQAAAAAAAADAFATVSADTLDYFSFEGATVACKVLSAYDGDTVSVAFRWLGVMVRWRVRVAGVDTPELRGGTPELRALATKAKHFVVAACVGEQLQLTCHKFDSFGRIIATLTFPNGDTLAQRLIRENLGVPYDDRKRLMPILARWWAAKKIGMESE